MRGHYERAFSLLIEEDEVEHAYGQLLAERIRDIRHLQSEAQISTVCQQQTRGGTPYQLVTEF
jgi:hypothetical protein